MQFNQFLTQFTYQILITLLFLGVYFFLRLKINRAEKKKLKSIKKRDIPDAVETDSPLDDQESILKKKGINAIEDRFTFIRRAFPILAGGLWFVLVFIPYIGKIPSVYISIIAAIFSVVAGVALRPFLENLFSGVVISFFKSIKIGDTVIIDGHYGLIEEIGLTYSVLKKWDWNRLVIPNAKLLQKEIENLTMNDHYIWAHIEFFVEPSVDLASLEVAVKELAMQSDYFNGIEEPSFWVIEMQKDAIKCWLAAWADNPSNAWELRHDMRMQVTKYLKNEGIAFQKVKLSM